MFVLVTIADVGVGSEGESLLACILDCKEGKQAEKSRNQPGAEKGRVHQTGEPAQKGSWMLS